MWKLALRFMIVLLAILRWLTVTVPALAQTPCGNNPGIVIQPPFDDNYTCRDLGSVPDLPPDYGGLTFKFDDPNTILIGGAANTADGKLYAIGVVRDAANHITGFTGTATVFADAAFNDGGVVYGPGNVLFLARWPANEVGQTKPGSTSTDKIISLDPLGVTPSPGGLNFVPTGYPGAGQLKLVSWEGGEWYTLAFTADGVGTFDLTAATLETTIIGGPEGFIYVPPGSPDFTDFNSMLVSEWSDGNIAAYQLDANGDPIPTTRVDFITGLSGAEGAVIDPVTGDFLFSTFGGGERVIVVQGFLPPPPPPDHFLCYKAKPTPGSERFVPRVVALADQFDTAARNFDVTNPLSLCTPADKRGEGITDPNTHLKGYQIKLTTTNPPQALDVKHAVRVTNQFGELLLDTLRPDRLLVPTAKSLTGPVDPPGSNNVDHYKCYKVKKSKGAPKFQPILGVSVSDQFINQPPKLFDLKRPTRLCTPVDKNGEGIKNPTTHLLCYHAKAAKEQPQHQPISPIFVNNQFGPEIVRTVKEEDLCVPSAKEVLGTLGPVSDADDSDNEADLEE
jgi:hypothetical protein